MNIISLSYSLAKANFKLRNEGSYLGIFWYLLSPLSFFVIILYIRGALFSAESIAHYPAYLFMGLIMVNFFSQTIAASIDLIRSNSGVIKSIKIPYEIFVLSTLFQSAFSHIFELLILIAIFAYLHVSFLGILWYLITFTLFAVFVLGSSFLSATIGLYFNDLKNIWAIASQLLLFITPVFYVVHPGSYLYKADLFNPLFYFLTIARDAAIYETVPALGIIVIASLISFGMCAIGMAAFNAHKGRFAEAV